MPDYETTIQLQTTPTSTGFEILAITAGIAKGHDLDFSAQVLKESLSLWENVPCMLDHPGFLQGPSVRDLAGSLHSPDWNEQSQGIQAHMQPAGPAASVLASLREAALQDPAIMQTVGFSAVIRISADSLPPSSEKMGGGRRGVGKVERIIQVASVDCVINPARGGRFLSANNNQQSLITNSKGVFMSDQTTQPPNNPTTQTSSSSLPTEGDFQAAHELLDAQKRVEQRKQAQEQSLLTLRLQTCRSLLKVSLESVKLPAPVHQRIERRFSVMLDQGKPFEPAELESAISEEQDLLSALNAAGAIQGPARVTSMYTSQDQIEAAVDDLFAVPRETRLASVKPAKLTGIRELYIMLTGDYDLHGGYHGENVRLATTADFTGLVKNALNKVVNQAWDQVGAAGYDWWQKIATVEHFNSLNTITGILIGTVGSLPSVSEGAEYTELAVGDSPETADFTKYGGYIPMTLELIDRDDVRRLRAYASELGNAAIRKISSLVAAVFSANSGVGPTMADGGALFNASAVTTATGHANLLTTALGTDYTAWNAVALAMYQQPMLIKHAAGYYGTGPYMAVWPKYCLVPGALKAQADALFVPRWASQLATATGTAGYVTWGGQVEVITVPDWTDTTDWAAVIDPKIAPAIIVGERFGLKPEIYTAGRETDPAVFMNDEHRIKVRMFTAILVQDFRPLHKENVAGG